MDVKVPKLQMTLASPRVRPNTPPNSNNSATGIRGNDEYDRVVKVVATGAAGVGKTSLITRITEDTFTTGTKSTIGVEFKFYTVQLASGIKTKCQIWDTAGQERFAHVNRGFYRGANVILFVFDVTDRKSFNDVTKRFFKEANWERPDPESAYTCAVSRYTCGFLIGNKCDMTDKREVFADHAAALAREYDLIYAETSAKSGKNVGDIFIQMAELLEQANLQIENEVGESLYIPKGNFETICIDKPITTPRSNTDESTKKSKCC